MNSYLKYLNSFHRQWHVDRQEQLSSPHLWAVFWTGLSKTQTRSPLSLWKIQVNKIACLNLCLTKLLSDEVSMLELQVDWRTSYKLNISLRAVCLSEDLFLGSWRTHGVMVSMSAFLACHQCWSAGSSLGWGLNFQGPTLLLVVLTVLIFQCLCIFLHLVWRRNTLCEQALYHNFGFKSEDIELH